MKPSVVALVLLLSCLPAIADEKKEEEKVGELTNELFVGEKLYIQDKGELYLVLEGAFARTNDGKETEASGELKYGVTDRLQLSAEFPVERVNPDNGETHQGISDLTLAFNYNFLQSDKFAAGVRSAFVLPTGDDKRDLGGGEFVWEPQILTATQIGKAELYIGVGGEIGEDHNAFTYSVAGAYPFGPVVGILEVTGVASGDEDTLYITPGFSWHVNEHIEIEAGVPIGVTNDSDDFQVIAKLIVGF
jgi:hypothetical protein